MLREVGKRDPAPLERFLEEHAHEMPRTMLRYAIEKMTPAQRRRFMDARPRVAKPASSSARR
jgi:3-methyladenine DNA glycosylase AlkD